MNKKIRFNCALSQPEQCLLDAQSVSRHFYVSNSSLSFDQIKFINGKGKPDNFFDGVFYPDGGSFFIVSSSVQMKDCAFNRNNATIDGFRGALFVSRNSTLNMENVKMTNNFALVSDINTMI